MDAQPQVIPVFIAGLGNSLPKQVARNWNRKDVIRIHFGPVLDLTEYLQKPDRLRTHKEIADAVMEKSLSSAKCDRAACYNQKLQRSIRQIEHVSMIVNPSSASGSTGEAWPQIASDLRSQFGSFRVVFTKRRGDVSASAAEAARKGAKFIIACGGDGTVSEVANGILSSGKDVELVFLPSGTGGDFRRTSRFHHRVAPLRGC